MGKLNKCLKIYTISFKRINLCTVAMKKLEVYEILYGADQLAPAVLPLRLRSIAARRLAQNLSHRFCPFRVAPYAHAHCHLQTFGKLGAL